MTEIPSHLRCRPEHIEYSPPIEPRPPLLPFGEIPWEAFEALSLELFEQERQLVDVRLYAGRGEEQDGIDLYGVTLAKEYSTAQCRRVRSLTPGAVKAVVDDFLAGGWAEKTLFLTFFTAATTEAESVAKAIEDQRARLATAGVAAFTVRDRRSLSNDLRSRPELVDAYFGPHWRRAFCPGHDHETTRVEGLLEAIEIQAARLKQPRLLDTGSLNAAVARAVRKVAHEHEGEVALLDVILRDPRPAARARAWIGDPPEDAEAASVEFWVAVARVAERGGEWLAAAAGWLRVAKAGGSNDLQAIVNGAIAASVAGDHELETQLLEQARAMDANHPKLRLHEAGLIDAADEALAALEGVCSDDAGLEALLELNRALLHARLGNLDEAEAALKRAEETGEADSLLQLGVVRGNVIVQRNRLARAAGKPFDARALEEAERGCLDVRDALMAEHRFGESVRALMLAADAAWLRTDYARAEALLSRASHEEIAAEDGAGVLGDAALRYQLPALTLTLTDHAPPGDDIRRMRAVARLELRQQVDEARSELRDIALGRGAEADMAALALCHDAAFRHGRWDDDVAATLASVAPIDAIMLEARHLARGGRYDDAKALLDERGGEGDRVRQLRFELAYDAEDPDAIRMVPDVLRSNPERRIRLLCGHLLLDHPKRGDIARAEAEARAVAQDPAAGRTERSDACDLLLVLLARGDRWREAQAELNAWARIDAGDDRLNVWQVRVGNRLRRERD